MTQSIEHPSSACAQGSAAPLGPCEKPHTSTRRGALRGLGTTALAAAALAPALPALAASDDATLLALGHELVQAWAAESAAFAAWQAASEADGPEGRAMDAASDASGFVVDRIVEMPATTPAGLGIKALGLCWILGLSNRPEPENGSQEARLEHAIYQGMRQIGSTAHG